MARRRLAAVFEAMIAGLAQSDLACLDHTAATAWPQSSFDAYCEHGIKQLERYLQPRRRRGLRASRQAGA